MKRCVFTTRGLRVVCRRCGRTVKTGQPPERVHAICRQQRIRGLGDVLAILFRWLGVARAVKAVTRGKDCGCKRRQEALNRAVPFSARKS